MTGGYSTLDGDATKALMTLLREWSGRRPTLDAARALMADMAVEVRRFVRRGTTHSGAGDERANLPF